MHHVLHNLKEGDRNRIAKESKLQEVGQWNKRMDIKNLKVDEVG